MKAPLSKCPNCDFTTRNWNGVRLHQASKERREFLMAEYRKKERGSISNEDLKHIKK